jgi:hypothetical protein
MDVQCVLTGIFAYESGSHLLMIVDEFVQSTFNATVLRIRSVHGNKWNRHALAMLQHASRWTNDDVDEELGTKANRHRDVDLIYRKAFHMYARKMTKKGLRIPDSKIPSFSTFLVTLLQTLCRTDSFVLGHYFDESSVLSRKMMLTDATRCTLEHCRVDTARRVQDEHNVDVTEWDSVSQTERHHHRGDDSSDSEGSMSQVTRSRVHSLSRTTKKEFSDATSYHGSQSRRDGYSKSCSPTSMTGKSAASRSGVARDVTSRVQSEKRRRSHSTASRGDATRSSAAGSAAQSHRSRHFSGSDAARGGGSKNFDIGAEDAVREHGHIILTGDANLNERHEVKDNTMPEHPSLPASVDANPTSANEARVSTEESSCAISVNI